MSEVDDDQRKAALVRAGLKPHDVASLTAGTPENRHANLIRTASLWADLASGRGATAKQQRRYRAAYRWIESGGQLPRGVDREHALAWVKTLIRDYGRTLRRIARLEDDHPVVRELIDDRERIRESKAYEATTGPPPDAFRQFFHEGTTAHPSGRALYFFRGLR